MGAESSISQLETRLTRQTNCGGEAGRAATDEVVAGLTDPVFHLEGVVNTEGTLSLRDAGGAVLKVGCAVIASTDVVVSEFPISTAFAKSK